MRSSVDRATLEELLLSTFQVSPNQKNLEDSCDFPSRSIVPTRYKVCLPERSNTAGKDQRAHLDERDEMYFARKLRKEIANE